ncbi:hypothetical protein [Paenibacillus sp. FSL R7-0331]|uniref:hypothetical protein n=1 Tax=Paenibacillus sp. FSL R7-0331 TaxID=1536773 RepID=UPI0004F63ED5|nr:hypothetical protein [Paenibacillus sp. FSL R7-0331]AIQ54614.1 hypothetical protein R70331_25970 [Paenibacillus sp. FSL R7-0331]
MNRKLVILGVLVLSIFSTGCSSSQNKASVSPATQTDVFAQTNNAKIEDTTSELYYGVWKLTKVLGYGPASAYDEEDIEQIIGKEVTYSNEKAGISPREIKNPSYKETLYTEDEFTNNYNIWLENIGVKKNSIKLVQIFMDKEFHENYFETGGDFFLTENKDQGVFFEMDKVLN